VVRRNEVSLALDRTERETLFLYFVLRAPPEQGIVSIGFKVNRPPEILNNSLSSRSERPATSHQPPAPTASTSHQHQHQHPGSTGHQHQLG
jgi:hypothetical protein